jgi:hypothetical protein
MTRVTFYEPEELTRQVVADILDLVCASVPRPQVNQWTRLEMLAAYDWAMREHLHASDNTAVRRREKPSFIDVIHRDCVTGCEKLIGGWTP